MLPYKRDQSFISAPISRVGSSTRLNQLSAANNSRPSSRPGTPGAYVASSLNPARNVPVTPSTAGSKLRTAEEQSSFERVPIVEKLREFEASFNRLSQAITTFKEENLVSEVKNLISIDQEISLGIDLLHSHQNLGKEISALNATNESLDLRSKVILKELISCRSRLKTLPKLPASRENAQKMNDVDVQSVLDYAMKLSKFSRTPATVSSQFIHPNNYVWPAEDALRRGMLAVASIKPDDLIKQEIGETTPSAEEGTSPTASSSDVEMEDVGHLDAKPAIDLLESHTHSVNRASVHVASEQPNNPAPATLDLDLFDPDDEYDSD